MEPVQQVERLARSAGGGRFAGTRLLAEEAAVALSYDGTTHAVMMATPADLQDFALGFSLCEGIIRRSEDLIDLRMVEVDGGIDLQMRLATDASRQLTLRRRALAGPVGCGLCGVESIEQALAVADPVTSRWCIPSEAIGAAFTELSKRQHLNHATRAVHAAAFWSGGLHLIREDVGRHNALDKLAGALAHANADASQGAVLITSRVSVELVQKTARMGAGVLMAVSAPTALAVRVAQAAGITLIAVVRGQEYEAFTHTHRILTEGVQGDRSDVA